MMVCKVLMVCVYSGSGVYVVWWCICNAVLCAAFVYHDTIMDAYRSPSVDSNRIKSLDSATSATRHAASTKMARNEFSIFVS